MGTGLVIDLTDPLTVVEDEIGPAPDFVCPVKKVILVVFKEGGCSVKSGGPIILAVKLLLVSQL